MRLFYFVAVAIAASVGVFACGDDDSTPAGVSPDGGTSSSSSSSSSSGSTPEEGGVTNPPVTDAGPDRGTAAAGGGFNVTERANTYALTEKAAASQLSSGYSFAAVNTKDPARSVSFLLRRGVRANAGSTETPSDIVAGTYSCGAADATVDKPALRVINMQYAVADQATITKTDSWQAPGPGASTCSVTLTTFDAAGGHAKGTFTGTLPPTGTNVEPNKVTLTVTGDFDVTRTN